MRDASCSSQPNMATPHRALFLWLLTALVVFCLSSIPCSIASPHQHHQQHQQRLDIPMANNQSSPAPASKLDLARSDFPEGFVFGTATASYQVEGAAKEGGRGPSIWDTFSHTPGKTANGDTGDVAVDQYHRYEEDIDNLKSMNMDAYRFSISWSRIIPDGQGPKVNAEGIAYYNRLIDTLISKGLEPYVTLYHWDLPQALEDAVGSGGWPSPEIVKHFGFYAETCFAAFGDRVKKWITFNEPISFIWSGYGTGDHAPGRTSDRSRSAVGNSATEPYLGAHHVLLSHATAVDIYRKKFVATQGGSIGITLDCEYAEPMTESKEDVEAAQRRLLFQLGWYLDPIFFGDYPAIMREIAGAKIPTFSAEDKALLIGSVDFLGINHYTSRWVTSAPRPSDPATSTYYQDQSIVTSDVRDNVAIGPRAYSFWLYIVPWGAEKLISWVWDRYKTPIYITENGMDTQNIQARGQPPPADSLHDTVRIKYYNDYLGAVLAAIKKGADVRSYFAWSLVDNFEWAIGYTSRFGLFYVDYGTLKRYPKDSAKWFTKFLQRKDGDPHQQF